VDVFCLQWFLYWWKISKEQIKTTIMNSRVKKEEAQEAVWSPTNTQKLIAEQEVILFYKYTAFLYMCSFNPTR